MNRSVLTLLTVLAVALAGSRVRAEDIAALISQGKLDDAREALEKLKGDSAETGNALYFRSQLESDAAKSASLLEKSLKRNPDDRYRGEIVFRLAQYYVVTGNYSSAASVIDAQSLTPSSAHSDDLARLRILASEESRSLSTARKQLDELQKAMTSGDGARWWLVDQARLSAEEGKSKSAANALSALAKQRSGPGLPQAMYLLCLKAIDGGRADDAARWYNLLRETYPTAVGLDALVDKLGGMPSTDSKPDTRAEAATGTFYSVKVRVFSSSDNASAQVDKFRGTKAKIEVVGKNIGGKKYSVVYIGRYRSYDDADKARQDLEAKTGEQYQVVAR